MRWYSILKCGRMRYSLFSMFFIFLQLNESLGEDFQSNLKIEKIFGAILEQSTHKPIPYANIGIAGSGIGTISNLDGGFDLLVPEKNLNDTLMISALGYGIRLIPIRHLIDNGGDPVFLAGKEIWLNEFSVAERRAKNKVFELGNMQSRGGVIENDTTYSGRSMALLIENSGPRFQKGMRFPIFLESARLKIFRNNLSTVKFRVRVNEVDKLTGKPGRDLLNQSVVVESDIRNGWLEFDLSDFGIVVEEAFFITFEQITDLSDRKAIVDGYREFIREHPDKLVTDTVIVNGELHITQKLKGAGIDIPGTFVAISTTESAKENFTSYVRETSFGDWKKVNGIMTATVTLSNQPLLGKGESENKICENDAPCQANQLLDDFMNETDLPGLQVAVNKSGIIVFSGSKGFASVENQYPVSDSTKFRINSISKSVTSLGLVKLVQSRKIKLDTAIQTYLPGFPEKKYPFSIRQLAGHIAGIRDYDESNLKDFIRIEHFNDMNEAISIIRDDTLLFEPGSKFHYSTFGWNIIGAVIESVAHRNYLEFMKTEIFNPTGMTNTCGDNILDVTSNRSSFYDLTGAVNDLGDWSYKYSGGGLLSTATDLAKFGNAILQLPENQKDLLFESMKTNDGKETGYGLGWYIGKDQNGHTIWYHSGDSFSSSSHLILYPEFGLVIAFLGNSQDGAAFDIKKIGQLFYAETNK